MGVGVATLANFDIPPGGRFARVLDVGIVAGGARQRLIALQETGGFHEPVGGSGDFELVIPPGARGVVEVQNIVLEGLAGAVGKHGAAVAAQRIRKPAAGGFQMTLQAYLEPPFGGEPRRVDDGGAHGGGRSSVGGALHMGASGAVAALAIDPFGNGAAQEQFARTGWVSGFDCGVGVVAEEALLIDLAAKVEVVTAVVAWIHGPESAVFGVPGDGGFGKLSAGSLQQVGARVGTGTQHKPDLLLDDIGLAARGAELMATLVVAAATLEHGVILAGRRVEILVVAGVVLDGVRGRGPGERSTHGSAPVAFGYRAMTGVAGRRREVARVLAGDEERLRSAFLVEEGGCHG